MAKPQPPKYFQKFIEWYCKPMLQESIMGDIEEQFYEEVVDLGLFTARRRYMWNVIRFFRPGIVKSPRTNQKLNNYGMFKNHYKVSLRSILRSGVFSMINIGGLAIGIASCLLILIYVKNEASYDTFNEKYDRTYRVLHYFGKTGEKVANDTLPTSELQVWGNAPVADALVDYFPQVENVARFTGNFDYLMEYQGRRFQEKNIVYGDSTLHQVFTWEWVSGDPKTALSRPKTLVLSKQMAQKYFGDEDPMGQLLLLDGEERYEVTGVYQIPANSHFSFDACLSMVSIDKEDWWIFDDWGYADFYTYFTLQEGTSISDLDAQIPGLLETHFDRGFG
ncbi:MAG: ABC transporter permease, partial [Bacteroidota bacterium]